MIRLDARYIALGLLIASAVVVAVAVWLGLSLLLSLGQYIETVVP